jgi:DnaJ-domain-containing protein 1
MIKSEKDKLKLLLDEFKRKQTIRERQVQDPYTGRSFEYQSLGRTPKIKKRETIQKELPTPGDYNLDLQQDVRTSGTTPDRFVRPAEYTEPTLRQAKPKSLTSRAIDVIKAPFVKSPEEQQASDWRVYAKAKVKNIPMEEASAEIAKEEKEDFNRKLGIASTMLGVGALGTGAVSAAALARGLGIFMATSEMKKAIIRKASNGTKEDFADFLNDNTTEGTKQVARLLELLIEGGLAGTIEKKAVGPLIAKIKAKINPEKGLSIIKEIISSENSKDLKALGLTDGASRKQVSDKYRELANSLHPDKNRGASRQQLADLNKKMSEINEAYTRLKKNYKPSITSVKDSTKVTTEINQKHIDALSDLDLKWGASRNEISSRYNKLSEQGKVTPRIKKAFKTLMKGDQKYNPYGESEAYMARKRQEYEAKTAEQTRRDLLEKGKGERKATAVRAITTAVERAKPEPTRYLPKPVGKPSFPAVDTPQAGFQIINQSKQKRLSKLLKELDKVKKSKESIIKRGKTRSNTVDKIKTDISNINELINKIQNKIKTTRKDLINTTGPIKQVETVVPQKQELIKPQVISKKLPTVQKSVKKAKDIQTQKKIDKIVASKDKDLIKTKKPKSYKEIVAEARRKSVTKPKKGSAIDRVLGDRDREKLKKAAIEKKQPEEVTLKARKKTSNKELAKLKREGADINVFAEKSRQAYLDFLEGKTKTDKSKEIDDFIANNFDNETEAFYSRKAKLESKPEGRKLKKPTKTNKFGKLKSFFTRKKEWKLYEEMQRFVHKYAKLVSERNVTRGAEGVYRKHSGNISVKSTNNMFTVAHEVAHAIASNLGIIDAILSEKDLRTQGLLKKIFVKYYPTNKKLSLEDTLHEGFAVLLEQYALQPKKITEEFPSLVKSFLKADGKYSDKLILEAVSDMDKIVAKFLSLSAYEQEASKIVFNERYVRPSTIYTKVDRTIKQQVDYIHMMEKHAVVNKKGGTKDDPSVYFRLMQSVGRIAVENIAGKSNEYVTIDSYGTPTKALDFNWRTLGEKIGDDGTYKDYNAYLYNRRLYHINEKVKRLEKKTDLTTKEKEELKKKKSILIKSKFDENTTNIIVKERPKSFDDFDKDFDILASMPIKDLMKTGLISPEYGKELLETKGYAKFARDILDEIEGEHAGDLFISGKVIKQEPLKGEFKGSMKPTKDLFISTAKAGLTVNEQIMLQKTLQTLSKLESFGETEILSRRKIKPEEVTFFPKINGNTVEFKDGNEWVTMKISNELLDVFVTAKKMRQTDGLRRISRKMSNVFIQGTTGSLYPAFAITNVVIDWIPAFAQSKNNIIPIYDGVKYFSLVMKGKLGKRNKYNEYWDEYKRSGAFSQTMIRTFEDDPSKILKDMRVSGSKIHNKIGIAQDDMSAGLTYLTERSEALNRFAEYVKARESGKIHAVAIEESARVTGAFSHRGKMWNQTLRAVEEAIVYANSTKQYIYSAIKAIADKDTRKRAIATHLIVSAVSLYGFFKMVKQVDDAKKSGNKNDYQKAVSLLNEYMNQNSYGLSNNLYTINKDLDHLTKVRVAGNYNDIGAILSMAFAEKMLGKEYDAKDYLKVLKDLYLPGQYDVFEANPGNITPQLVKPFVEIAFNKKTFPEIKEITPDYMLRLPREKRYYPWTNDTAIWLASTPIMKALDKSPIEIEHWMKGTGGRAIDIMTKYSDEGILSGIAKGQIESFKRIVANETYMFNGVEYSQFYEDAKKSANKYTELRKGSDRNAISKQKEINDIYRGVTDQLKSLRKVNSSDDVEVPLSISNKIFEVIHDLNTGKERSAQKKYERYKNSIESFIDKAEMIIE